MTISQGAVDVRTSLLPYVLGLCMWDLRAERVTLVNSQPQTRCTGTVVIATATNSQLYEITPTDHNSNSYLGAYTADSSTTKAEVADGLAAALNDTPHAGFDIVSDGVDTITFTATAPGDDYNFTLTEGTGSALMTTSVTGATDANDVAVGVGCMFTSLGDDGEYIGAVVEDDFLTTQVDTIVVTYAASEMYSIAITVDNETYTVGPLLAATDTATVHAALVAAINAILPANTVIAAGTSPNLTLTAEVAGKAFKTEVGLLSGTIARLALTHTTALVTADINKVFLGVSELSYDTEIPQGSTDAVYPAGTGVRVLKRGKIVVSAHTETIAVGDPVYIETASGSTKGHFYKASSATRILLPSTRAKWAEASANSLVLLELLA